MLAVSLAQRLMLCLCVLFVAFSSYSIDAIERVSGNEWFWQCIEKELAVAKSSLDCNTVSDKSKIEKLKSDLDVIWHNIKTVGFSESSGTDQMLRPAYVTMQGIIERVQYNAFLEGIIAKPEWFIITPRMPTPLLLSSGKYLNEINIEDPKDFAFYRRYILEDFLKNNGKLYAVYSYNAYSILRDDSGLSYYMDQLAAYPGLHDVPELGIELLDFPSKMAGAIYFANDKVIATIESKQVMQIDNNVQNIWSIKTGHFAVERVNEVRKFLKESILLSRQHVLLGPMGDNMDS